MRVEEAVAMASLVEGLEAREAAARLRVEDLESRIAELTGTLEVEREAWSRLRVTRETARASPCGPKRYGRPHSRT
ncbi:hypothetical protein [Streptomyces sp. NPDC088727]|uniref:hypothetical protein n=1 Tax=Streptomyces sp. NPDC088727 TaxID=3365875 RepID=UPI0038229904